MEVIDRVWVRGPLARHARGFAGELTRLGFKTAAARKQLQLTAGLSEWLAAEGLGTADLSGEAVSAFLAARRRAGHREHVTPKALAPLLGYLRSLGLAPEPEPAAPQTLAEQLLADYRGWLLAERGLRPKVVRGYVDSVAPFVTAHAGGWVGLERLAAGDVIAFMTAQSRRLAPKTVQRTATALRSLLRYWHVQGLVSGPLDKAVPRTANRRPGLPQPLEAGQAAALLGSCDQRTPAGRRDLAMLTLLARLGLRAGEVSALTLEDIDWHNGEITIAGKGGRRDRLPLPPDAGEAIAAWLQDGRPAGALDRCVFIRVHAPRAGSPRAGSPRRLPRPRSGLGWASSTRTGCGTLRPLPFWLAAGRWPRSGRYCATPARSPRRRM
jgi:integrase/recombinase XerD